MNSVVTISLYKVSESNNTATLTLTACALAAKTTLPPAAPGRPNLKRDLWPQE